MQIDNFFSKSGIIILSGIFLMTLGLWETADAQRRVPSDKRDERRQPRDYDMVGFADNLNYEIVIGNIGGFGNIFNVSLKPRVGYRFGDYFTTGLGGKISYTFFNNAFGPNQSFFDYGALGFARIKIANVVYVQGEYTRQRFQETSNTARTFNYPLAGLGYASGNPDGWSYGFEIMAILNDNVRNFRNEVVEYWINISYRF
jgi:hypothetical protein